jgi:hypothetical protein
MEPPNESSVTQLECLTLGAQYTLMFAIVIMVYVITSA